jgi:hypothetical protein
VVTGSYDELTIACANSPVDEGQRPETNGNANGKKLEN